MKHLDIGNISFAVYYKGNKVLDATRICFVDLKFLEFDTIVLKDTRRVETYKYRTKFLNRCAKFMDITWNKDSITLYNLKGYKYALLRLTLLRPLYDLLLLNESPDFNIALLESITKGRIPSKKKALKHFVKRIAEVPLVIGIARVHWINSLNDSPEINFNQDLTPILENPQNITGCFS